MGRVSEKGKLGLLANMSLDLAGIENVPSRGCAARDPRSRRSPSPHELPECFVGHADRSPGFRRCCISSHFNASSQFRRKSLKIQISNAPLARGPGTAHQTVEKATVVIVPPRAPVGAVSKCAPWSASTACGRRTSAHVDGEYAGRQATRGALKQSLATPSSRGPLGDEVDDYLALSNTHHGDDDSNRFRLATDLGGHIVDAKLPDSGRHNFVHANPPTRTWLGRHAMRACASIVQIALRLSSTRRVPARRIPATSRSTRATLSASAAQSA